METATTTTTTTRPIRIGINGFGRMGRLFLRALFDAADDGNGAQLEVVHVNEIKGGLRAAAHLLKFDSIKGTWRRNVSAADDDARIVIDTFPPIKFTEHATLHDIPWEQSQVDIVVECSGKFLKQTTLAPHFAHQGVRKVVVSSPVKEEGVLNIVMGVNDDLYDPQKFNIVTAASCTTNCLAPMVKVVHEKLGIVHGTMTTIHCVTNTQIVVDAPHADLRRARSCLTSLVPTTTGSATAITVIFPSLAGKLNGMAVRVPLLNASLTDAVFQVARPTTVAEVNHLLKTAADTYLHGTLGYEDRPLVSEDFRNDPRACILDAPSTMVIDDTMVKLIGWYDNEWGYVNQMLKITRKVATLL
ncbi:glyceraldehyde-3-phosphate dehydrogenase (phosphorylating) [Powellomyces hirtus]|uniref:Glyceraldehyde-3-phosphate dehydrogenase n=1 Tax=Powellomyces hirtus TaxID=109895 RepID=A0A507DTX2_9FUNG|nr:glyceraldehyde-3-phosphate dehydrogenase (phosphorylating) [Powellomyces hirtus]